MLWAEIQEELNTMTKNPSPAVTITGREEGCRSGLRSMNRIAIPVKKGEEPGCCGPRRLAHISAVDSGNKNTIQAGTKE